MPSLVEVLLLCSVDTGPCSYFETRERPQGTNLNESKCPNCGANSLFEVAEGEKEIREIRAEIAVKRGVNVIGVLLKKSEEDLERAIEENKKEMEEARKDLANLEALIEKTVLWHIVQVTLLLSASVMSWYYMVPEWVQVCVFIATGFVICRSARVLQITKATRRAVTDIKGLKDFKTK